MTNAARHLADGVLAFALFALGYAVNDLQHGVVEVHEHWWSSAAVLLVIAAAGLRVTVAIAVTKRPRKPEQRRADRHDPAIEGAGAPGCPDA